MAASLTYWTSNFANSSISGPGIILVPSTAWFLLQLMLAAFLVRSAPFPAPIRLTHQLSQSDDRFHRLGRASTRYSLLPSRYLPDHRAVDKAQTEFSIASRGQPGLGHFLFHLRPTID